MGRFWLFIFILAAIPAIPAVIKVSMPIITVFAIVGGVLVLLPRLWRWVSRRYWW
jgi:hypothetical protein